MATEMEEFAAQDTVNNSFRSARRENRIYQTGVDASMLNYNYGSLGDVVIQYFNGFTDRTYDHQLTGEPNPLQPFFDNMERRHR